MLSLFIVFFSITLAKDSKTDIRQLFFELCKASLNSFISAGYLSSLASDENFDFTEERMELLADVFWAFGLETKEDKSARAHLITIIRPFLEKEIIPKSV